MSRCECAACKRRFSCLSAFDAHQRLGGGAVTCLDPAAMGSYGGYRMELRPDGVWQWERRADKAPPHAGKTKMTASRA